jgi:hypothetical protein
MSKLDIKQQGLPMSEKMMRKMNELRSDSRGVSL